MRIKFLVFLTLILPFIGCGKSLKANLIMDSHAFKYSVPFEQGFIFKEEGKTRILLKFYKPNKLFTLDTDDRMTIFITADEQNLKGSFNPAQTRAFLIRVQLHPCSDYMKIQSIRTQLSSSSASNISCEFLFDASCASSHKESKLYLSFSELPLKSTTSLNELKKQCIEYDLEELDAAFGTNWF